VLEPGGGNIPKQPKGNERRGVYDLKENLQSKDTGRKTIKEVKKGGKKLGQNLEGGIRYLVL